MSPSPSRLLRWSGQWQIRCERCCLAREAEHAHSVVFDVSHAGILFLNGEGEFRVWADPEDVAIVAEALQANGNPLDHTGVEIPEIVRRQARNVDLPVSGSEDDQVIRPTVRVHVQTLDPETVWAKRATDLVVPAAF